MGRAISAAWAALAPLCPASIATVTPRSAVRPVASTGCGSVAVVRAVDGVVRAVVGDGASVVLVGRGSAVLGGAVVSGRAVVGEPAVLVVAVAARGRRGAMVGAAECGVLPLHAAPTSTTTSAGAASTHAAGRRRSSRGVVT